MKTTIKKLIKMGLEKEQIKGILEIDEEKYSKLYSKGTPIIADNLPSKIDYALKGGNVEDLKFAKAFDEIFKLSQAEELEIDVKQKAELVKEFPSFIKYIEMKRITDQIEALNKKKVDFETKIAEIDEQINSFKTNLDLMRCGSKREKDITRVQEKIETLIVGEDIKIYKKYINGSLFTHIHRMKERNLEVGDMVDIADEKGINRYIIKSIYPKSKQQTLRFKENIMTKQEG